MKVAVDRIRCEGYGFCEERAADLLRLSEDGVLEVLGDEVPAGQEDMARQAVRSCPVAALTLVEAQND
ncbi:ferredoxin [Mycobacterium sp. 4858]|uniref:ferredoxin n=1 Tax=Mycobacterium sp. 4858 TaxID=2057185 RepID=UPI000C847BF6|nr:ferredoxin [Mycobacterium sp. 4858]